MPKNTVHGGASYEPRQDPDAIPGTEEQRVTELHDRAGHGDVSRETEQGDDKAVEFDSANTYMTPTPDANQPGDVNEPVPTGNIQDVLTWVGDDSARAQRALDAERASDAPRTTLVAELEKRAG